MSATNILADSDAAASISVNAHVESQSDVEQKPDSGLPRGDRDSIIIGVLGGPEEPLLDDISI